MGAQRAPLLFSILPDESRKAYVDPRYVLEHAVPETAHLDLGTFWSADTCNRGRSEELVTLTPGEVVAAARALGCPVEIIRGRLHSQFILPLTGAPA